MALPKKCAKSFLWKRPLVTYWADCIFAQEVVCITSNVTCDGGIFFREENQKSHVTVTFCGALIFTFEVRTLGTVLQQGRGLWSAGEQLGYPLPKLKEVGHAPIHNGNGTY